MSACKYCGSAIGWHRVDGNWRPTNADGSPHYCKSRDRTIPDVLVKPGPRVVGREYEPSCGECEIPPWEVCACSAAAAKVA